MRNIIKRVLTLFVVVGLLCSIQVGLTVNSHSAKTVTESEETEIVELSSGNKSYAEYRAENSDFEYANEDIVLDGGNYITQENSEVEIVADYHSNMFYRERRK